MDISKQLIYPLGETAAAIRGENELWVAMVLRNKVLRNLKPSQLAAVCGSLVSEGIKLRPTKSERYQYFFKRVCLKITMLNKNNYFGVIYKQHSVVNKRLGALRQVEV